MNFRHLLKSSRQCNFLVTTFVVFFTSRKTAKIPNYLSALMRNMDPNHSELIDLTKFTTLYGPENVFLHKLFKKYGFELRIAGGAVRDVLLGLSPKDIDYATDATPTQMIDMFNKENIRMLNRNGEAHGTVTARINDKANFEVTTLRIDTDPDGRHSKVVFTDDWRLDAARRDLTVNSMFLSIDVDHFQDNGLSQSGEKAEVQVTGRIYDFFGGRDDLSNRRIRFVGNPAERIREDYLRILRYFRFHGRLSKPENEDSHDPETINAIAENCDGLGRIAGERCWMELRQILLYRSTPALFRRMASVGLFPHLGIPSDANLDEMDTVWSRGILSLEPNPATCLASLLSSFEQIEVLNTRLRLSNFETTVLAYIVKNRAECLALGSTSQALEFYKRHLLLTKEAPSKMRPVLTEMMRYVAVPPDMISQWNQWEPPKFPVSGRDLQNKWSLAPKEMRPHLLALRTIWVDSGCTVTAEELLTDSVRDQVRILLQETEAETASHQHRLKKPRH